MLRLKHIISSAYCNAVYRQLQQDKTKALEHQNQILAQLLRVLPQTAIGKDHKVSSIRTYEEFQQALPVFDYEDITPYIDRIKKGESNVLWQGKPLYFAKTSGTTSGSKYIPITSESMPHHITTARHALVSYLAQTKQYHIIDGKMIFLSGSPELDKREHIPIGRLSGIVNHHIPAYLQRNQVPSYATNCIPDWEQKLDAIVAETLSLNMTLISGIPPWVQMYFERLLAASKQSSIKKIFPHFQLVIHGGVNYEPYKKMMEHYIGSPIHTLETYPASEGFIAYQDDVQDNALCLNTNAGLFFEFINAADFFSPQHKKISLKDVVLNTNYVVLVSTNAGLWSYCIGDTVKFLSVEPYKIVVTGRIKHFISAFGEHVIVEEVNFACQQLINKYGLPIKEFTVAPFIAPNGNAYHEWFIEFDCDTSLLPSQTDMEHFLDDILCEKNIYYKDLIKGHILQRLKIQYVRKNTFINYMKHIGKLGEQNKLPRLCNDRTIADAIQPDIIQTSPSTIMN